ncbi:preprotein translocase subunit SecG [Candidatus Saccharibacteria bacterium]|jgi:preprotein translocase subunit SecG|nr:preprotein translocase subunit SecG [Candidatus Saccharibacteria bacterium]MDO4729752.1 preprotein translocase subunit SecG [Candidatus Saccharibacteria bacterium]
MNIGVFCTVTTFVSAILLILLILLQQRGASLGAGLNGSGELYTERRGLEKTMFNVTVVIAVIFCVSILSMIIFG